MRAIGGGLLSNTVLRAAALWVGLLLSVGGVSPAGAGDEPAGTGEAGAGEASTIAVDRPTAEEGRFRISTGITRAIRTDSAETHGAASFAATFPVSPRWRAGIEAAVHPLYDSDDGGATNRRALLRLTTFVDARPTARGGTQPFLTAGAGLYSWAACRGCGWVWSPWDRSNRSDSFGFYGGAGFETAIHGSRSFVATLQIHPYSTHGGGWPFAVLLVGLGR